MFLKFAAAPITLFGYGCRKELPALLKREQKRHALIVTDQGLEAVGIRKQVSDLLEEEGIACTVYNQVLPNPTLKNVEEGTELYKKKHCDFIVAVGGGSANDCAKAIRMLSVNPGKLKYYEGGNKSNVKGPLLVAVNTTAGTASEVSRAYLINDDKEKKKMIFKDDFVMPDIAVNDTEFMIKLPKHITAQTGMDALTHAVESYLSTTGTVFTNMLAEDSIRIIWKWLPEAFRDGSNEEARDQMALGQYLAGLSFGSAGLGLVHAMAHQLGALYSLPHGLCNAILLPPVLKFYCTKQIGLVGKIARILAPGKTGDLSEKELDLQSIEMLEKFSERLNTKKDLKSLGVKKSDFMLLADKTLKDGCLATAPYKPAIEEVKEIFESVYGE